MKCSRLSNIEYLFFDLDGTLTDPYEGITKAVAHALEKFGIHIEDRNELKCFIGPPLNECFMEKYNMSEPDSFIAVDYFREYFTVKGIYENELFPETPKMLQAFIDNGYKLVIATSKPTVFAEKILDRFDLKRYFISVYGSELNGERVRKSDVIKYALKELKINDTDGVLMIGDREHDIIGAHQANIRSVGVRWGYGSFEELNNAGADFICKTAEELERLLVTDEH